MSRPAKHPRNTVTALVSALLVLPLAACSGLVTDPQPEATSSDGSPRSKCQAAVDSLDQVVTEAQQQIPELVAGGTFDATAFVEPVLTSLNAARDEVTDPEVITALDDVRTEWGGLVTDFQSLDAPNLEAGINEGSLSELVKLKTYGEELSAIVAKRLPAIQETGTKLQQACNAQ